MQKKNMTFTSYQVPDKSFLAKLLLIGFERVLQYDKALFTKCSQKYKYQQKFKIW